MHLAQWMSDYYLAPLGEVLGAMLPNLIEADLHLEPEFLVRKFWVLTDRSDEATPNPKHRRLFHAYQALSESG